MRKIDGISILGLEIRFHCIVDSSLYDLGAVILQCEDRNYILDVVRSEINNEDNHTLIMCDVEVDEDTFKEGSKNFIGDGKVLKYDLVATDFMSPALTGTIYIGNEYEVEPESQTLFVKHINNEDSCGLTQAIELELE